MRWGVFAGVGLVAGVLSACGCGGNSPPATGATEPGRVELGAVEAPGLHNVYRLSDKLYSGSSPEGDEGFASLERLGVKTIISVDGARPDVERAHGFGMRYVHLPIGYDGVPQDQGLKIARAVRDRPGPVYIHCHHGKHRGPAAAAVAHLCLDERCGVEQALAELKRAGTDPHYTGLYAAPGQTRRPSREELGRIPDDFPEVADVGGLAQAMVAIDERWDRLKAVREAGWKAPSAHPDVDPAHEALLLLEGYREAARQPQAHLHPEEFRRWLAEAEGNAKDLVSALRRSAAGAAESSFQAGASACTRCHARYRDLPR